MNKSNKEVKTQNDKPLDSPKGKSERKQKPAESWEPRWVTERKAKEAK